MNERRLVSGLLSGRLKLRDVRDVDARRFADRTLAEVFLLVQCCREAGAEPRTDRIVKVMEMRSEPTAGIAELVDQLRAEG